MRYLLNTHAFIWKIADSGRILQTVLVETEDPDNEAFVRAVSLWEIAIKTRQRKLDLGGILNENLIDLAERMGIQTIELSPEEAAT